MNSETRYIHDIYGLPSENKPDIFLVFSKNDKEFTYGPFFAVETQKCIDEEEARGNTFLRIEKQ